MSRDKTSLPKGVGMSHLRGVKNRFLRKTFWELTEEKRQKVTDAARRYFTACKTERVEIDPDFFREVIIDLRDGVFQEEV